MKLTPFKALLAAAAVALPMLLAGAGAQAQTKLKFAHVYEVSEPYHTAALWAAEEIKKRTGGRYEIEVFPASQLGKETDINQAPDAGHGRHHLHRPGVCRAHAAARWRSAARRSCSATSTTGRSTPTATCCAS